MWRKSVGGIIIQEGTIDINTGDTDHPAPSTTNTYGNVIVGENITHPYPTALVSPLQGTSGERKPIRIKHLLGPPRGTTARELPKSTRKRIRHPRGEANAGGNKDIVAKLQLQVEELNNRLRDIAPSRGLVKHITFLPFSYRLRHEPMPKGFKIPSSLSRAALKWFHKLPPNSIDCWQDTVDLFMDKFGVSIVANEDEEAFMNLKQKLGETLWNYSNVSKGY
ncbi:hypothetical protein LIER_43294 [Lithospermum erythrorhizon]|uniref:Retrotransposon gag domain-containing protein n=1 Tax=Lithospermum erythrorhizon TaxID=34254 RepID=A0AAV3PV64_LITER